MRRITLFAVGLLIVAACGDDQTSVTTGASSTTATIAAPTTTPVPTIDLPQEPVTEAALMSRGPLGVGITRFTATDPSRGDREVEFKVRYPATTDAEHAEGDAPADPAGAPYPVILTSPQIGNLIGNHYASHGFVVVEVRHAENDGWAGSWLLDTVFDRLLSLDALADAVTEPLAGLADSTRAGNIDFSADTLITIALAGASVDPDFYLGACADAGEQPPFDPDLLSEFLGWESLMANNCMTGDEWNEFQAQARELGLIDDDGSWMAVTDERILAGIAGGAEGAWLFGDTGLAGASSPVLLWAGTEDDINVYSFETAFYIEHLGSRANLISLVGADHIEPVLEDDAVALLRLFSTAYFHGILHESASASAFVTQDFVDTMIPSDVIGMEPTTFSDVVWGYVEE
jgi:predicted dienelactone hydrolase